MPTDVTPYVKVGSNVLQVVGEFAGKISVVNTYRVRAEASPWNYTGPCVKLHTFLSIERCVDCLQSVLSVSFIVSI